MSDGPINPLTRGRGALGIEHAQEEVADRQLLERFVARRDEAAFATLVERHGPMVLAACRRVLRDAHEAEDACQATFLVLARKACSLRQPERLGNWLYGVAIRAARKAQRTAARYCAHAMQGAAMQPTDSTTDVAWQDLGPVLDGELERLPGKYRTALVLCYLQGLSAEEAARQLGCPRGTILSRLARGRERLRSRLVRRGLALSAGLFAVLLTQRASASTPLATAFIQSTAKAACSFAARGGASAALVPSRSAEVALSVLRGMFLAKLQGAALCLLVVGVVLTGVAWGLRPGKAADPAIPEGPTVDRIVPKQERAPKDDKELLQGAWRGVISEQERGKLPPIPIDKTSRFIFNGDGMRLVCDLLGEMPGKYGYLLNSEALPKTIDLTVNGQVWQSGIYELEDDILKLCMVSPELPRPTEFVAKGDQMIWIFKRDPVDK